MVRFGAGVLAVLLTALVAAAQPALVRELGSNRFRYPGAITQLVVSPDGKHVAALGSADVWVYDLATGRPVWRSPGPRSTFTPTFTAAFTAAGVVTLEFDFDLGGHATIRHYHLGSPLPFHTARFKQDEGTIDTAFGPDGTLVALTTPKRVTLLDTHTGREVNRIPKRNRDRGTLYGVHFSPDGRTLAVLSSDNACRIIERTTGRDIGYLTRKTPRFISFSPDGGRFTAVQEDNAVVTLDVRTGTRKTWTPKQPYDRVLGLPNDQLLGVELSQMQFHVLDARTGKVVRSFRGPPEFGEVSLTPDGKTVMVADNDGRITLLDVATGRKRPQSADDCGWLSMFRFHDGDRVSALSEKGWVQWNLTSGARWKLREKASDYTSDLSADGYSRTSVYGRRTSVHGREVVVTKVVSGKVSHRLKVPSDVDVLSVWFKDYGRQVGIHGYQEVLIWDLTTNGVRRIATTTKPNSSSLTSEGRWFAVWIQPTTDTSKPPVLRIFDLNGGQEPRDLKLLGGNWGEVCFTADGTRLVRSFPNVGTELDADPLVSTRVEIFDPATGRYMRRFQGPFASILDISPDGRVILTSASDRFDSIDNTIRSVEVATGNVRWELPKVHDWDIDGVGFAPDLRRVAVGTSDGVVRVWNADGDADPPVPAAAAWDALLDPDAAAAFGTIHSLTKYPQVSLPLLAAKLPPEPLLDAAAVAGWVRDLDAPQFRVRQAAAKSLAAVASRARPALEAALNKTPSPEVRERLTDLLESLTRPRPADVRTIRSVEVVERILADRATPPETRRTAVALLQTWAAGADGATLTTEATETLNRFHIADGLPAGLGRSHNPAGKPAAK